MRTGQDLITATVPFTEESTRTSWWYVGSTFAMLVAALVGAALTTWWPLRLVCSVLVALLMMRTFITFHDYMHRAILVRSKVAKVLFSVYSALALTPPRSWKKSHNFHHGHVGQISSVSVGAFPMITTKMWREASWGERASYRIIRHPLSLLAGYITIFFINVTLLPLLQDPKHHWDSALALAGHVALITVLWLVGGFATAFFVVLLPMTLASALGSYLFYAQHSFEGMHILQGDEWSYPKASMESSSYLKLNKVMQWFTGNIGFHHIHHLNVRIPFYRLPEAMAAIPELQSPVTTTLKPGDILECFRCCLWDEDLQRAVAYGDA